jgi:hypothetical protein
MREREHRFLIIVPNIAFFVICCSVVRVVLKNGDYFVQSL